MIPVSVKRRTLSTNALRVKQRCLKRDLVQSEGKAFTE